MPDNNLDINNQNINIDADKIKKINAKDVTDQLDQRPELNASPKWINNRGEEVKKVFGFNENAELVNARVAMIGFLMLLLTELAFAGEPATQKIFGIN